MVASVLEKDDAEEIAVPAPGEDEAIWNGRCRPGGYLMRQEEGAQRDQGRGKDVLGEDSQQRSAQQGSELRMVEVLGRSQPAFSMTAAEKSIEVQAGWLPSTVESARGGRGGVQGCVRRGPLPWPDTSVQGVAASFSDVQKAFLDTMLREE
jgi:hypothetical protein